MNGKEYLTGVALRDECWDYDTQERRRGNLQAN